MKHKSLPNAVSSRGAPGLSATARLAWGRVSIIFPLTHANFGPAFALVQNLCPPMMRAQCVAVFLFAANVANLILAPQLVGIASDLLGPRLGAESLRFALIPLAFTGFWAAAHYWLCGQHLRQDLHGARLLPKLAVER